MRTDVRIAAVNNMVNEEFLTEIAVKSNNNDIRSAVGRSLLNIKLSADKASKSTKSLL